MGDRSLKVEIVETIKQEATDRYYLVREGIVKAIYDGVFIICKAGEVFKDPDLMRTKTHKNAKVEIHKPTSAEYQNFINELLNTLNVVSIKNTKKRIIESHQYLTRKGGKIQISEVAVFANCSREYAGEILNEKS